jgi:ferredoxin
VALKINEDCIACGACEAVCPVNAISEGKPIYTIEAQVCVECKGYYENYHCAEICPVDACIPAEN